MEVVSSEVKCEISVKKPVARGSDALELAEKGIRDAIAGSNGAIKDMCAHIAGSGGKRIRPQLVLHSGLAFSRLNDKMLNAAVAAELIHMASLVHDDIIDRSELRRGRPSVNKLWGNHAAVLCGDWLFARAFGILAGKGLAGNMGYMVEAIESMCHGEIIQAGNKNNLDIGLDSYYEQIIKKTAKFLECCCKSGALAGGADGAGIAEMGEFGLNIGLAFQIIDDILDFQGNTIKMGKPKGEDLRQGIVTLPVILLLQDEKFANLVRDILSEGRSLTEDMSSINTYLFECGAIDKAYDMAGEFIDKALNCLDSLPDSHSKACLNDLASSLRRRVN